MAEEKLFDFDDVHTTVNFDGDDVEAGLEKVNRPEPDEVWVSSPCEGSKPEEINRFNEEHMRTYQVWNETALRKRGSDRDRPRRNYSERRASGPLDTVGATAKSRRLSLGSGPQEESDATKMGGLPDREPGAGSSISRAGSTTSVGGLPGESRRLSSSDRNIVIKLRHAGSSGSLTSSASSQASTERYRPSQPISGASEDPSPSLNVAYVEDAARESPPAQLDTQPGRRSGRLAGVFGIFRRMSRANRQ